DTMCASAHQPTKPTAGCGRQTNSRSGRLTASPNGTLCGWKLESLKPWPSRRRLRGQRRNEQSMDGSHCVLKTGGRCSRALSSSHTTANPRTTVHEHSSMQLGKNPTKSPSTGRSVIAKWTCQKAESQLSRALKAGTEFSLQVGCGSTTITFLTT